MNSKKKVCSIRSIMMCFKFKSSKSDKGKSAPELRNKSSEINSNRHQSKSAGSATGSLPRRSIPELYEEKKHNFRVFSSKELAEATKDFSKLLKIGEGGFGSVYKARIVFTDSHGVAISTVVAIKKLNTSGMQGHKEWVSEVQFLGVLDHPKLVKLLGYCAEDGERGIQRLLVYEYMSNKSLDDHLFNRSVPAIPWITRLHIILGAAEGMTYLHEGLETQVIYRDFKSSNILLDRDFSPKLSDFGLAREGPMGDRSHVSTAPVGTYGYAAPEYVEQGHLSTKSDLYSFGVVLYEILTGRRAIERNRPTAERKLLEWVKQFPADSRKFVMIMDPRLGNQYSLNAAKMIAKLADSCLSRNARDRPAISQVVEVLKRALLESEQDDAASSSKGNSNSAKPNNLAPNKQKNNHAAASA